MPPVLRAALLTLAMPVVAFVLAQACIYKMDSTLRDGLRRQYPKATAEQIARASVAGLDKAGAFGSREVPELYFSLRLLRNGALLTGVVGFALGAGILWAGHATRNRRDLLLALFRPGLYLTLSLIAVLTLAQAVSAAFALYFFETIFVGRVHFIFMIGVVIGGALAFFAIITAMFSVLKKAEFRILGDRVTPEQQPALWKEVNAVCQQLNTPPPDTIVLGLEPTFYVTESEVTIGDTVHTGRTLFVSLSYSRLLTIPELRAILGHEMAHFIGADTQFSQRFFPVYRATFSALAKLSSDAGHISVAIARLPALSFLGFFLQSFATSEKNLSRARETEADAVGASVAGASALATALVKVHAYGSAWREIIEGVHYRNEEFREVTNLVEPFTAKAKTVLPEDLAKVGEQELPHPIDSHPTLAARLASLKTDLATASAAVVLPTEEGAAASLVTGIADVEIAQSAHLRKLLVS